MILYANHRWDLCRSLTSTHPWFVADPHDLTTFFNRSLELKPDWSGPVVLWTFRSEKPGGSRTVRVHPFLCLVTLVEAIDTPNLDGFGGRYHDIFQTTRCRWSTFP